MPPVIDISTLSESAATYDRELKTLPYAVLREALGIHGINVISGVQNRDVITNFFRKGGMAKTINGTEARELFIVKQNLERTYRDILLFPFNHIIKPFNHWPEDVFFHIFDITLTTLDKSSNDTATLKTEI
jgi:hypothetical protein